MKRGYYGLIKCYNFYLLFFVFRQRRSNVHLLSLKVYCLVLVEVHRRTALSLTGRV